MMPPRFIACASLTAAALAAVARADDVDDVRTVYRTYTAALAAGDIDKAKSLVVADDKRMKLIDNRRASAAAEANYKAAVEKVFPGATHAIGYGPSATRPADAPDPLKVAFTKEGATLTVKDTTEVVRLRRDHGWKIDLNAMYSPATVDQIELFRQALTESMNAIAAEVTAGRYKSYDDAAAEMETRVKMRIATPDLPITTRPSP